MSDACEADADIARLFARDRNCWRTVRTQRAAVLVDGAAYFAALETALAAARRSVLILGWDFDPRIKLRHEPEVPSLGGYLRTLVDETPELEIHILVWSVAVLHGPGSPLELLTGGEWQDHPRIHYRLDTNHPIYGAHHQKVVCIDDHLAFVGGMDLTVNRWDTPEHRADDPRRINPDGEPYGPVHDIQMLVDGEAAAAMAEMARQRWHDAIGDTLHARKAGPVSWPAGVTPDFGPTNIAVARSGPGCREGATLTEDALRTARHCIYLEAQYLTAPFVRDILAEALQRRDGPEIVILVTRESHSRLEQWIMGGNRDRLLATLAQADNHGRLRAFYAVVPDGRGGEREVLNHAKLVIVDDTFLRVGSSNLNNRSIGLDTECDLALCGRNDESRAAISRLRCRLLAEHLDCTLETVEEALRESGSLIAAIDRLNTRPRGLRAFRPDARRASGPVFGTALLDPSQPFGFFGRIVHLVARLFRPRRRRPV